MMIVYGAFSEQIMATVTMMVDMVVVEEVLVVQKVQN